MKTSAISLLLGTLLMTLIPIASATTVNDIASQLICSCGCTMVVSDCNCGTADDIRALIQNKLDQGNDKTSILQSFISEYGEKMLAAPTKSGFNLTAWVLPFVAILGAIVTVTFVIRNWTQNDEAAEVEVTPISSHQEAQARARLKRELDEFDA